MKQTESVGGVVVNNEGKILVVSQHGRSWSLPKGHIERGEDYLTAAKREIYEESGIKELVFIKELGSYQRHPMLIDNSDDLSEMKTIYMFLFKAEDGELQPIDKENPEARWIDKEDIAGLLTHQKDKEFFLSMINVL